MRFRNYPKYFYYLLLEQYLTFLGWLVIKWNCVWVICTKIDEFSYHLCKCSIGNTNHKDGKSLLSWESHRWSKKI